MQRGKYASNGKMLSRLHQRLGFLLASLASLRNRGGGGPRGFPSLFFFDIGQNGYRPPTHVKEEA